MACPKHLKESIASSLREQLAGEKPASDKQMSKNDAFENSQDFYRKQFDIMEQAEDLGLQVEEIYYNASAAVLYE
jgi:hypothetical protein